MTASVCRECGVPLSSPDLMCARCGSLVHGPALEQIAVEARALEAKHDWTGARDAWRRCLPLLPPATEQYRSVHRRASDAESHTRGLWAKVAAWAGPGAAFVWKFKGLMLGFTKLGTLLSMFAWVGVYWALYGWVFAVGSVLSIYIHEMGHVIVLKRFGIPAGAPMFIPGFGAFIRLRQLHLDPVEDARVGLAGPLYGLGAALVCFAAFLTTGWEGWRAIAHFGAFINLFNLLPVWQLDGARGWRSLAQNQRVMITALAAVLWFLFHEPFLLIIALVCGFRCVWRKDGARIPDQVGFLQFGGIMTALAVLGYLSNVLLDR